MAVRYSVLAVVDTLVRMRQAERVVPGAVTQQAEVGMGQVPTRMVAMVRPAFMVAATVAVLEHRITAAQLVATRATVAHLAEAEQGEDRRMEGLLVPQAVMAALEPSESLVGR